MPKAASVGLGAFVRLLQGHNVLPARLECRFGQYERLQECAFVAQEGFGLDLGYTYCLHAYGTFSTSLAIDFSGIARKGMPAGGTPVPASFDAERLISLVSGRSIEWLAVASAVVHEERFPHASGLGDIAHPQGHGGL